MTVSQFQFEMMCYMLNRVSSQIFEVSFRLPFPVAMKQVMLVTV